MGNYFDQYDSQSTPPVTPVPKQSSNFFDQYDGNAAQSSPDQPSGPGIGDRLLQDAAKRQQTVQGMEAGSPILAGSKAVGQAAGYIAQDVPGEVVKSAYDALDPHIQEGIKNGAQYAVNSKLGKLAVSALKAGGDVWDSFKDAHPDMASLVEDAANAGSFLAAAPTASAAVDVAGPIAGKAALGAGKAAAKVVTSPVKSAADGIGNIIEGFSARAPEILDQTESALKGASNTSYADMRSAGAELTNLASDKAVTDVVGALNEGGKPHPLLHGDTMSVVKEMEDVQAKRPLQLEELDQYKRVFSGIANKNRISNPEDAKKALQAVDAINESVDALTPADIASGDPKAVQALQNAQAQWAKAKKFEQISDVIKKADGDPNSIKRGFHSLLNNDKAMRGFTQDEREAIQAASTNTTAEGLFKMVGKFGLDLGTSRTNGSLALPALAGGVAQAAGGSGASIPLVAAGTAARQTQKYLARGKAEKVLQAIDKR